MPYLDDDIKSTAINLAAGLATGLISFMLNKPLAGFFVAAAVFLGVSFLTKKALKLKKERKWWASGLFVFALSWLVLWTALYNL